MMKRLVLVSALLTTLGVASAQPADPPISRPAGTRTRTAAEEARYGTGPDELQPRIGRPRGFVPATRSEAEALLSEIRASRPDLTLEALLPGLEDYRAIEGRLERVARLHGDAVSMETLGTPNGLNVRAVTLKGAPTADGLPRPRVLIIGGIHSGTEKAGFEAATRYVEKAAKDPALRGRFDLTIIPLANPIALVLGTRENARGIDINRTFEDGKWQVESKVLGDYISARNYDVSLDLHTAGDPGRNGFFLIRGLKDHGLGDRIMRALPKAALMDVPGAKPGEAVIGPYHLYGVGLVEIPSIKGTTMDLTANSGARYVYTFEAPTRADPELQVRETLRFIDSALHNTRKYGRFDPGLPPPERAEVAPERALTGFRRPDGTLDWKGMGRHKVLPEVGGLAHFGLALFLKEVAAVAATGDRARLEEFFDGLMTTDFYKSYGLFVAGARLGEVAYTRYLQRYVKPRFVNGVLKTNLVLAAGIALPMIVDGTFEGRAFVISVGALGLSSAAVRAGAASLRWVHDLRTARQTGALARAGFSASKLARFGGWFYTAAELAVVLYLAEEIEGRVNAHLDREAARETLADAGRAFLDAATAATATPASLRAATERYEEAWNDYRNFLYAPLQEDEARLAARLEGLAREAKLLADERRAALERVERRAILREHIARRHGSVEAWANARAARDEAELQRKLDTYLAAYEKERAAHLRAVYEDGERGRPLLGEVEHLDWLVAGAEPGAANDPYGARRDGLARWGRARSRAALTNALAGASGNRLEAYDDELEVLERVAETLSARDRGELAAVLAERAEAVRRLAAADRRLIQGGGLIEANGITGALSREQ